MPLLQSIAAAYSAFPYRLLRARPLGKSFHLDQDSLSTVSQSLSVFLRHRIDLLGPPINQQPQCPIDPPIVDLDPRRSDLRRRCQDRPRLLRVRLKSLSINNDDDVGDVAEVWRLWL
ncbi:hypothetical protein Dsin_004847 [Dipteronia sinensis]|uniref:Uncharacterized protein n=1 Tax=Dipteronia sinensis TaxID=43782 RepID=A0AAE0AWB6_9ROSI|nr:hypothetical protein Dsin_004847 [Dipteronia sinensis]